MDPSKIRVSFIDQLWEFYYERIQTEDEPIVFLTGRNANEDSDADDEMIRQKMKTGPKSRKDKGKGKAREVEVEKKKRRAVPDGDSTRNDRGKKVGSSSRAPRDEEIDEEDFTKAVNAYGTDSEADIGPLDHHRKERDQIGSSASQNESPAINDSSPAAWSTPERRETFLSNLVGDKEYVSLVKCLSKGLVRCLIIFWIIVSVDFEYRRMVFLPSAMDLTPSGQPGTIPRNICQHNSTISSTIGRW